MITHMSMTTDEQNIINNPAMVYSPYNGPDARSQYYGSTYPQPTIQVQIPRLATNQVYYPNNGSCQGPAIHNYPAAEPPYIPQQQNYPAQAAPLPPTPTSVNANANTPTGLSVQSPAKANPPLNCQMLLLSLAEEYFAAAHGQGSMLALARREVEMEKYYKLIATGLGCLEAVLKNWRLEPHREAVVRLRYATILYEETENVMEAETALSKGILVCERHRLVDLKYNMQHLLARIMFTTNARAALKFLDGVIQDVEAYKHVRWIYAFRFLRVSLSLDLASHQDTVAALTHLKLIAGVSKNHGHHAIFATASTLEALTHLRHSSSLESIEQAQRALAAARSIQMDSLLARVPQLAALTYFVDLCCSLQNFDPAQATLKMQNMQAFLDPAIEDSHWTTDGRFSVPITQGDLPQASKLHADIVRTDLEGSLALELNWLPKEDIYALAYLLSGATVSYLNASDGRKGEKFLKEGIRMLGDDHEVPKTVSQAMTAAASRQTWRRILRCYMQVYLIFALCARTEWPAARFRLSQVKETLSDLGTHAPEPLALLSHYLQGVIHQGTGDLASALSIFQTSSLALPSATNLTPRSQVLLDLSILSALNTILILRPPTHPQHSLLAPLLSALSPLCLSNPSKSLQSAYYLILATTHPAGIVRTKQYLQSALQAAKQTANTQLTCITLNFMSAKFFKGVVGGQAEKSARASLSLAMKGGDRLWWSVADGVLGDTLEVQGKGGEAEGARKEGREIARGLEGGLWRVVEGPGDEGEGGE